ncbi:hypothetical protein [Methanobrevibacter sp.]|uniref:hypothetical protein n=1 Tax=Methanobrevibacter sp. TaxID=66852 RepID=UPI003867ADD1
MKKKLTFMFFLIILSFLIIGAASASDDNETDIVSENQDDSPITSIDLNDDMDRNAKTDELKSESSSNTINSSTSQAKSSVATANKITKTKLKIATYSNFVKKGSKYNMYLTDSNGKAVANKIVKVSIDGKTYKIKTSNTGKFAVKVKSSAKLKVKVNGDKRHYSLSKKIRVFVKNTFKIKIGNSKLLTNGYLRVYLQGSSKVISKKTLKIKIGKKTFTKKTNSEGFIVLKPQVKAKTYKIGVKFGKYKRWKNVKCIEGNVSNPLKNSIPTKKGVPDIDLMPGNYVMGDGNAKYTLLKSQYKETIKRDSYCLYMYDKLPKYTFFKTKASPGKYHILKREKWNVIERALNTKLVKANKYSYWPGSITVNLKGKSYTYPVVRDIQNTGYNCGPASSSVCSQALKNYYSERYFQIKGHCVDGMNIPVIKNLLENHGFKAHYFYDDSINRAMTELKTGAAIIAYLPNHYVSVIDISPDGKKILVSNSYGSYNVGSKNVPTNWVSLKYFKSKFAGIGLVVKLDYNLESTTEKQIANYYNSMGKKWTAQNVHERIPNLK